MQELKVVAKTSKKIGGSRVKKKIKKHSMHTTFIILLLHCSKLIIGTAYKKINIFTAT